MKWSLRIGRAASLAILALGGCASVPSTPAQTVYAMETSLGAALAVANAYAALPPCPQVSALCSDPATLQRIYTAGELTSVNLSMAQSAVRTGQSASTIAAELTTAQIDLNALTALTSQVKTQ